MIRAALTLYEHSGDEARLEQALQILRGAEEHFADDAGAFFMVADDAADVPGPKVRNVTDGPTPSGIGLMAENYARLFHLTGDAAYRAKAEALLAAFGGRAEMLGARRCCSPRPICWKTRLAWW